MIKDRHPRHPPAKCPPRAVRLGVVQAGTLVEERLVQSTRKVTIGTSLRNTVALPGSDLPRTLTLIEARGDTPHLCFGEAMDGRVTVGHRVLTLQQARQQRLARRRGELHRLPLDESARGKLSLGDTTLLFQLVAAPPHRPRPQLPPSVRRGLLASFDWVLASSFILLAVLHAGLLVALKTVDFPLQVEPDLSPIIEFVPEADRPVRVDLGTFKNIGPPPREKIPGPGHTEPGKDRNGVKRKRPICDEDCKRKEEERRRKLLVERVSRTPLIVLLGNRGRGRAGGATADLIRSGSPDADMARAFQGMGGFTVSRPGSVPGGGLLTGAGHGDSGRVAGGEGLFGRIAGPQVAETGRMVRERVPRAVARVSPADTTSSMDPVSAYGTIRRGMPCIEACYQRLLKRNPGAEGKVSVCLDVNTMGRVGAISISSDTIGDPALVACSSTCIQRLRFPPLGEGSAEVCTRFFLRPSGQ